MARPAWDGYENRPIVLPPAVTTTRRMGCACGGVILVPKHPDEDDLTLAIRTHGRTKVHLAWAARIKR